MSDDRSAFGLCCGQPASIVEHTYGFSNIIFVLVLDFKLDYVGKLVG